MLTFNKQLHEYKYDGVVLPSVTQILENVGLSDFSAVNSRVMQIAQERGSFVHLATQLFDQGELDESTVDPELSGYLDGWKAFVSDFKPKFTAIEKMICNLDFGFAGTLDRIAVIKRKKTLIDIKTGVKSKAHEVQHGGYSLIEPVNAAWTVYLSQNGKYTVEIHDLPRAKRTFLAALTIYKYKKQE